MASLIQLANTFNEFRVAYNDAANDITILQSSNTSLFNGTANVSFNTLSVAVPPSIVGTNITGTATAFTASNVTTNANLTGAIVSTGNATLLGAFSSANLASALTDETGTGAAVFANTPTFISPILGTPTSGTVTNLTGTASININGTVGATTPTTGAFTTLNVSTTSTLVGDVTLSGELRGPSTFTIDPSAIGDNTGLVIIKGNLQVDGNTTTINSTTLTVTDKNIVIASGAVDNAAADGAGITIEGSNTTITYLSANDTLNFNKNSVFSSNGSIIVSKGTTGERPASPVSGMFRFNTTTSEFEGYNGSAFASIGGSAISNDTNTASDLFPTFLNATSNTALNIFTSNSKLLYKPSSGEFKAEHFVAQNGIFLNSANIATNYTIVAGSNGMSAGPVTVNSGVTVTISSGSVYTVV